MIDFKACKESLNPFILIDYIIDKKRFNKEHPDYFIPDGLVVFTGPQGSGKTLSAVNYVERLIKMYPKAKIVSNLLLIDYPIISFEDYLQKNKKQLIKKYNIEEFTSFENAESQRELLYNDYLQNNRVFEFKNADDLSRYNNGELGVIFLIDEVQLYFNSLESKNINPDVMVQISQQRKQRKHIVCTSQVFGRMAKPLREQFSSVIICKNLLGFLQFNRLVDRDSISDTESTTGTELKGQVKKRFLWLHNPKFYKRYDTYYVIKRNNFVSEEEKKLGIYGTDQQLSLNMSVNR